jgi:hypothetical protein
MKFLAGGECDDKTFMAQPDKLRQIPRLGVGAM